MSNNNSKTIKVNIPNAWLPLRPEINIEFLNGEVTIPSHPGGYVVASGCGSGKTTAIRQIILERYKEGIVYSAFTIEECNEMYAFLKKHGPAAGLNIDNVVVLHSNTEDEGVNNDLIRKETESLKYKSVVICTHYKLLNEYPELFQEYGYNTVNANIMSVLKRKAMEGIDQNGYKTYPRQLIIVDEMPTCKSANFNVTPVIMTSLSVPDTEIAYDNEGKAYTRVSYPFHYTNGGDFRIAQEIFRQNNYGEGKDNPFKLFNNNTKSGKLMNDLALSIIFDNFEVLKNSKKLSEVDGKINMNYTLADQVFEELGLRIILFDGTGDLTFVNSQRFYVLTYDNKYNSPITINKMPFKVDRNYKSMESFVTHYNQIASGFNYRIDEISDILANGHKVLIVTWKNFKVKNVGEVNMPIAENDVRAVSISDYINSKLRGRGFIEDDQYSIIHYQSGLDRATNKFRDYDTIVFLGEFHVPNYVVEQFNQDYRVMTSPENYLTYQLMQAICRLRIRKHQGEDISIYFTEDWDSKVINNIKNYLISDQIDTNIRDTSLDWIKPRWRKAIDTLCSIDNELKIAIETGRPFRLEFNLDEIYEIIPMCEKKVKYYNPLIRYLKTLGIELKVNAIWGKNRYTNKP